MVAVLAGQHSKCRAVLFVRQGNAIRIGGFGQADRCGFLRDERDGYPATIHGALDQFPFGAQHVARGHVRHAIDVAAQYHALCNQRLNPRLDAIDPRTVAAEVQRGAEQLIGLKRCLSFGQVTHARGDGIGRRERRAARGRFGIAHQRFGFGAEGLGNPVEQRLAPIAHPLEHVALR